MQRILVSFSVLLLALCLWASHGYAQAISGSVVVTVQDQTGAVVPSAKVTLTNKQTGTTLSGSATAAGLARFPIVDVGNWTVTVEAANFKKFAGAAAVSLNATADVLAKLEVGAVSQTVEVAGAVESLVETTASQLSKTFDSQKVVLLPVGSVNDLAMLAPNVVHKGDGVVGEGGSVGGQRARNNNFTLDGVDNNDISVTGSLISPIQEAVAQFTILQNQFNAEFGHSSGGQFNTITKSGTNELHGDAWWYLQNRNLNALDHLTREAIGRGDLEGRPRYDNNRLGGQMGGRVVKNKLFYFGAFQYTTTGSGGSSQQILLPTAAAFTQLAGIPGVSSYTLDLLKNNVNPASAATKSVTVFGRTVPVGAVSLFIPNFNTNYQWQGNVDQNVGDHDQLHYRFFWSRYRAPNMGAPLPKFNGDNYNNNRLLAITDVHSFSPTLLNEFRYSYRRNNAGWSVPAAYKDFPNVEVDELSLNIGPEGNSPQGGVQNINQWTNNVSWQRSHHAVKFGMEVRNAVSPSDFLPRGRGEYDYATLETLLRDIKPDGANGGLRGVGSGFFAGNQYAIYGFLQDDWKATSNLTLNLGLRYEYTSYPRDAATQKLNALSSAGPFNFGLPKTDKNNWAPRLGFAYAPRVQGGLLKKIFGEPGKSSIRAGAGVAYDVVFQNLILLQLPPQLQQELDASSGSGGFYGTDANFLKNGGLQNHPIPPNTAADAREATQSLITDQHVPVTYTWSLSFQREMHKDWSLETRYVGTRGLHLPIQFRWNNGVVPPANLFLPTYMSASEIPAASTLAGMTTRQVFLNARKRLYSSLGFAGNVTAFEPVGNSTYHAASMELKRRFARSYMMTAAYTYSHTIDDSTNELFSSYINPRRPEDVFNLRNERGNSALDRRQRFVTSAIWELPLLRKSHGLLRQLGGWQLTGIFEAETGQWATPLSGVDSNGNSDSAGDRAIINSKGQEGVGAGVNAVTRTGQVVSVSATSATNIVAYLAKNSNAQYVTAEVGAKTNAGRNTLRGAGINNFSFSIVKDFFFKPESQKKIQFMAYMLNAFNHPQYTVDALNFGYVQVASPDFNDNKIFSGGHRTIQLALKFHF